MNRSTDPSAVSAAPAAESAGVAAAERRLPPQLYLIPLLGVALLVIAWFVFSWALHAGDDPRMLVRDMRVPNHGSWQKAYALAELLRNPRNEAFRCDAALCRELASVLDEQLSQADTDPSQMELRVFLCRALGEFHVPDGLPTLLRAAEAGQRKGSVDVQCAALEAIAILAGHLGPDLVRHDSRALTVLLDASRAASDPGGTANQDRVAATAAFTLGVLGGPSATPRLRQLLADRRPEVRYNAATGLARHGDAAAIPVLLEMLDTDSPLSLNAGQDAKVFARRRESVISNAIRATLRLVATNDQADRQVLIAALEQLCDAPELSAPLRSTVQAAHIALQAPAGGASDRGGL